MNEQNFHSDVGQVAGGSIVNTTHGPSQSNVITINGAPRNEPLPTITDLQRQAIKAKAEPIAEAGGVELVHVYRIIFTRFGIERILDLPKVEFMAALSFLDELEKNNAVGLNDSWAVDAPSGPYDASRVAPTIHFHPTPCQGCIGLTGELGLVERQARAARVWAGVAMSVLFAGAIGITAAFYTGQIEAKGRSGRDACYFGSGVYSVGSVLPIAGSKTRECLPNLDGPGAHWETIGTPANKK
ncbi:hypothetical protein [Pandoraea sputorum]|uniref:Uncharacterized protein n=1 Tax=Pandoraea sputorum TaxID=93222 RepID=A0A239SYE6_9BURK|nr:hypothetical protein [Pandoraea sputorum]APD12633.1 hypothetical protein NA29_25735 [Pandoraea sputorum]SNU89593.1 Uncharacterised protein [Pandoraea sputorum]